MIFRQEKTSFKKVQKIEFSKGVSPWVLAKNSYFSYLRFLGKSNQETSFSDVLDRKEFCLDKKSQVSKKKIPRNQNFPKGLVYSFWPKMATFLNGGFWAYPARKHRLFDILDTKECFLDNSEL